MSELKEWIRENMTIVCDTREKSNSHILYAIEQLGGKYSIETLKTADYACRVCGELKTELLIERKNSLDELAANITKFRERFENELRRARDVQSRLIILIEGDDYNRLFEGRYLASVGTQAFLASLFTFQERYGVEVVFIKPEHVGRFIYNRFYYFVREALKRNGDHKQGVGT